MDEYTRRAHSVCKLCYHAVFVIKYRRKVMDEEILAYMKDYTLYLIEECYGGKLVEMNGEPDHVHLLFELPPALSPSTVICNLKTQLSKGVRKRYWGKIQPLLWKDSFWSDSYFLTTTGGTNIETLERNNLIFFHKDQNKPSCPVLNKYYIKSSQINRLPL